MEFKEFIAKYNGKKVEVTGSTNAQNQCVDLANAYIRDVLNLPIIAHTNAQDFPKHAGNDYDVITYRPGLIPEYGDIMVWNLNDGVGHIAVFVSGSSQSFDSFDQNWPVGSACKIVAHNYKGITSWMRSKHNQNNNNEDMTTEEKRKLDEVYGALEAIRAGAKALRQRTTDGALFADSAVLGKSPEELKGTVWADSQALAILMRAAGVPTIDEAESKKDKYVRVKSARELSGN